MSYYFKEIGAVIFPITDHLSFQKNFMFMGFWHTFGLRRPKVCRKILKWGFLK